MPPAEKAIEDRHIVVSPGQKRERKHEQKYKLERAERATTGTPYRITKWETSMTDDGQAGQAVVAKSLKIASNLGMMIIHDKGR